MNFNRSCRMGLLAKPSPITQCSRTWVKSVFLASLVGMLPPVAMAQTQEADLAGNEEVMRVMKTFQGRGALTDDSPPTSAEEALTKFDVAAGLRMELVASEPTIMQPLYLSFDERGRMWVVQYRQYPFPAGLKIIRYDQYLRAVFDKVPAAPPHHVPGLDRLTVFEDRDADGSYEHHRDVITDLNIATSVVTGRGGLWVLNPPYLLFYPDANGDAEPDGPPTVHLSGFGLEDTHSVANSLRWGPDGWLYAANGSTTTANVATRNGQRTSFQGQCIWRYHPVREVFEIFAEGGGNTFSTEIDAVGRVFSGTNNGATRGMYYPQGSYGEKNWGKHGPLTNPYAFGYFDHMRFSGDADRFAQTFAIYEGGTFPSQYHGQIIAANALHNRVWASQLLPDTSTYRTVDMPPIVETSDRWFRPVDVKVGPDGAVYLADWYDSRLSHVDPRDTWHKTSGRIYRIVPEPSMPSTGASQQTSTDWSKLIPHATHFDLTSMTSQQLMSLFGHPNKFFQQTAVRVLAERRDLSIVSSLQAMISDHQSPTGLPALWTLYQLGALDDSLILACLQHPNEHLRRWAVRLVGDDRQASEKIANALVDLALKESEIQVRGQLACSAKRLPAAVGLSIAAALLTHDEDRDDLHQGLLLWWALEAHCRDHRTEVLSLFSDHTLWDRSLVDKYILERLMQRFAVPATKEDLETCSQLLQLAPQREHRAKLINGLRSGLAGRSSIALPSHLQRQLEEYRREAGESDLPLRVRSGDAEALAEALRRVASVEVPMTERIELVELLGQIRPKPAASILQKLLNDVANPALQRVALIALGNFDDPAIGKAICRQIHSTLQAADDVQRTAISVLASRPPWAELLLDEIDASRLKTSAIPPDILQQLRLHKDSHVQERIQKIWGRTRQTPKELNEQIEGVREVLRQGLGDARAGGSLFKQKCGTCHTLFDEGGQTGPNLTGYERDNLQFILPAIVDPSAAIREEFTAFQILTTDGRVQTGLMVNQDSQTITLRGVNNQVQRISRDEIENLQASEVSLMPEGLLRDLNPSQIRDLFAYLTSRTQIP